MKHTSRVGSTLVAAFAALLVMLAGELSAPADLPGLTPDEAARWVWGSLQNPAISASRVSDRLADANAFITLFDSSPKEGWSELAAEWAAGERERRET